LHPWSVYRRPRKGGGEGGGEHPDPSGPPLPFPQASGTRIPVSIEQGPENGKDFFLEYGFVKKGICFSSPRDLHCKKHL